MFLYQCKTNNTTYNYFILLDATILNSFHVIVLYFIGMFNVIDFIVYVVIIYVIYEYDIYIYCMYTCFSFHVIAIGR